MKKIIAVLMVLMIALCALPALADESVMPVADGETRDFDNDGVEETLTFTLGEPDEYGDVGDFTIGIGDQRFSVTGACGLYGRLYAAEYGGGVYHEPNRASGTLFLTAESGPSDDPLTYCYLYTGGTLYDVGRIPAMPENMTVGDRGVITASVRADHLGTWGREADFVLAKYSRWDDALQKNIEWYRYCESPRSEYPMGMIVTLKRDLPLLASRFDTEPTAKLTANQDIILATTDDVRWLYVTDMDGETHGWVRIGLEDYIDCVVIDGKNVSVDDVFDSLFYAD